MVTPNYALTHSTPRLPRFPYDGHIELSEC
jgi:hypothetical protein